jgi:hypothetical protein
VTLRLSIEQAIYDKAPEVTAVEIAEDPALAHTANGNGQSRFALPMLHG